MSKASTVKTIVSNGNALLSAGIFFTVIIVLWPILMVMSEVQGTTQEQLMTIADSPRVYTINFAVASLIAPAITWIMLLLAFGIKTKKDTPFLNRFGALLLAPYVTLVSLAYTSQYTLLQSLLREGDWMQAKLWFFDNQGSIPYFANQLGYTFFALSALMIGYKFLLEQGILKAIGYLLWASGVLSIAAFVGLAINNDIMNSSTIISGLLTVPIGVLVMVLGWRRGREHD
ncbi:hypothetical protein [Desulfuribacillus alkaliarsenatis]|uniref:DUF4386 domain-containing protein n=1 Tax=Desulfuribacillus alkaliarsenatis TaxID=766136 RepID=A0A1E5G2J5_9FIRM|nr:hypothetical protein [Desulfuribacillus alkaliarsenatis]OEF97164.1 hypothetical protein BHF68_06090 [Desulfuribacillus alkaliarsenatis]